MHQYTQKKNGGKHNIPAGKLFVVCEDLFTELVHKLVKTQVHLSFNFIIQKLFPENSESIVSTVIVQV